MRGKSFFRSKLGFFEKPGVSGGFRPPTTPTLPLKEKFITRNIVCSVLREFHDEVFVDYVKRGNYGEKEPKTLWDCPLLEPTGLLLEYCTASPEFVELLTVWKLGTEEGT